MGKREPFEHHLMESQIAGIWEGPRATAGQSGNQGGNPGAAMFQLSAIHPSTGRPMLGGGGRSRAAAHFQGWTAIRTKGRFQKPKELLRSSETDFAGRGHRVDIVPRGMESNRDKQTRSGPKLDRGGFCLRTFRTGRCRPAANEMAGTLLLTPGMMAWRSCDAPPPAMQMRCSHAAPRLKGTVPRNFGAQRRRLAAALGWGRRRAPGTRLD